MAQYDSSAAVTYMRGNQSMRQQAMEIAARQQEQLHRQQYEMAFASMQDQHQAELQAARHLHDSELFDRHEAGRIAEMQLQHLQQSEQMAQQGAIQGQRDTRLAGFDQQRLAQQGDIAAGQQARQQEHQMGMAQYEAGVQEQRDYRLGGQDLEKLARTQDFQGQMAQYEGQLQESRDYRQAGFTQGLQESAQDFTAQQAQFKAQVDKEAAVADAEHRAALTTLAQKGHEALQKILERREDNRLDKEYQFKADRLAEEYQLKEDQHLVEGLSTGKLILDPPVRAEITKRQNAILSVRTSTSLDQDQKKQAIKGLYEEILDLRRTGARDQTAEEKLNTVTALKKVHLDGMTPEQQSLLGPYFQVDEKGKGGFRNIPKEVVKQAYPDSTDDDPFTRNDPNFPGRTWARDPTGKWTPHDAPKSDTSIVERQREFDLKRQDFQHQRELRILEKQDKKRTELEKAVENGELTLTPDQIEERVQKAFPSSNQKQQTQGGVSSGANPEMTKWALDAISTINENIANGHPLTDEAKAYLKQAHSVLSQQGGQGQQQVAQPQQQTQQPSQQSQAILQKARQGQATGTQLDDMIWAARHGSSKAAAVLERYGIPWQQRN
jgi:hypothetical protein